MKTTDSFETFEQLLASKTFEELNANETSLVMQFVDGPAEYHAMQQIMHTDPMMQEAQQNTSAPRGGADEVWSRFAQSNSAARQTERPSVFRRKVSVMWPAGMAAALVLSFFARVPSSGGFTNTAGSFMHSMQPLTAQNTDTIIQQVPVYYQISQPANLLSVSQNSLNNAGQNNATIPSINSIIEEKTQRQGTNANELGELTRLAVAMN